MDNPPMIFGPESREDRLCPPVAGYDEKPRVKYHTKDTLACNRK